MGHQNSKLNLEQYSGIWFTLGRYPTSFDSHCAGSAAKYELVPGKKNEISITNICYEQQPDPRGIKLVPVTEVDGTGKFHPINNTIDVTIGGLQSKYIVLWTNYELALVTSQNHKDLWILSRRPQPTVQDLSLIKEKIRENGFSTSNVIMTVNGSNQV